LQRAIGRCDRSVGQRIGLLLDAGIEAELAQRQIQVAEACRATLGLDIGPVLRSDQPLGVSLDRGPSGASWGRLEHPDALLRAGERLRDAGATAIAVVARFPEDLGSDALTSYRQGSGVDALAGAEAVISHLLVRHLQMPCAHAPALAPLPLDPQLDPRAAAEELGYTFLACVLVGLSRAPDLIDTNCGAHWRCSCIPDRSRSGARRCPRRRGGVGVCGAWNSCDQRGESLAFVRDARGFRAVVWGVSGQQLCRGRWVACGAARGN
jgi:hypothetical protein